MAPRKKRNYVNNPDFLAALIEYQAACREAEDQGDEKPPVPRYIAECIFQISTRIASRGNFAGYPFKEDMIMDGVENCLLYMGNFKPEKYEIPNPFAYFSQIIWNAFLRRIKKEKKELYIKFKSSQELLGSHNGTYAASEVQLYLSTSGANLDYMNKVIEDFEESVRVEKEKKQ